jgi:hypothetical protein
MASRKRRSSSSVRSPISTSSSGGRGRAALRTSSLSRSRVGPPEPVPCASASDTAAPPPTNQATRSEHPARNESAFGVTYCQRSLGASCGSQHPQILLHRSRPRRTVATGERLPVRLPQTGSDTGFVPGGQGVAGSNPAVPTRRSRSEGVPGSHSGPFSIFGSQSASLDAGQRQRLIGPVAGDAAWAGSGDLLAGGHRHRLADGVLTLSVTTSMFSSPTTRTARSSAV